ncbi:unnamed protein product [Trifolium pratense]|uniref:Uncharacterized protein n=1 Tax=Trifolium pratense TaxID=57577 RepID=A0ACB0M9L8_TRIPR|nr:unnamed protein product [Trifolium pratense]
MQYILHNSHIGTDIRQNCISICHGLFLGNFIVSTVAVMQGPHYCYAMQGLIIVVRTLHDSNSKDIKGEHIPSDLPPKQAYSILISFVELLILLFNGSIQISILCYISALGLKFSFCSCLKKSFILSYF